MGRQPTRRRRRGRGNGSGRMCGGRGASAEEGRRGQGVSAAMAAGMMASREGSRERTGGRHDGARGHDTRRAAMGRATASGRGDGTERRADTAHRSTREGPGAGTGTGRRGSRPCGGAWDPPGESAPASGRAPGDPAPAPTREGYRERTGGRGARHDGTAHDGGTGPAPLRATGGRRPHRPTTKPRRDPPRS